jgi:uncharacterized protein YbjT (DUF2867 family)
MKIAVAGSTGLIGRQVVSIAAAAGHEVVGIARETGFDLLAPAEQSGLADALAGVEVVIDVTQSPSLDEAEASAFFETVATNLGRAAQAAGVRRTVLLSIVGADKSPDYGYYVAKVAQENATRAAAPGPIVLRATQFHEFAGQMLGWNRDGDVTRIIDVATQPVASVEIARRLVELATASTASDTELAGPQVEKLVDQVRTLVARSGENITVEPIPAPASMAAGSMLPDSSAVIRGPRWADWIDQAGQR